VLALATVGDVWRREYNCQNSRVLNVLFGITNRRVLWFGDGAGAGQRWTHQQDQERGAELLKARHGLRVGGCSVVRAEV